MNISSKLKAFGMSVALSAAVYSLPLALERAAQDAGADLSFSSSVQAQAKKKVTRKLPGLREGAMKRLGAISDKVSPPEEEGKPTPKPDFNKGLVEAQKMEKWCKGKGKCNRYELGQLYRFYAFCYYSLDNYPKAMESYRKIVAQSPEIPIAVELDALNALAQLSYATEKYQDALDYIAKWKALSTIIPADKIFLEATILYTMNKKTQALKKANEAIGMVEKNGKIAKEQWYGLQIAILLEKENYKTALPVLEKLIVNYPQIRYWTQYAGVNGLLGRDKKQMHSLDAVYIQGKLAKKQDIVNMAYLYLGEDAPYKGAKVLSEGIKSKKVEKSVKYLKVLAAAWRAAREFKKAIAVLNDAVVVSAQEDKAKRNDKKHKSETGNLYAELVGLYSAVNDPKSAVDAGKKAVKAGNLKRACEVHTNIGISYVDMRQYKSAVAAFEKAKADKQCRAIVQNWIRYARNEQKKKEELAKAI